MTFVSFRGFTKVNAMLLSEVSDSSLTKGNTFTGHDREESTVDELWIYVHAAHRAV